jgi:STE24 endopeptidase
VTFTTITGIYLALYLIRQMVEIWLEMVNADYVRAAKNRIPDHLAGKIEPSAYVKAIDYHLAGYRFHIVSRTAHMLFHWFFIIAGFQILDAWLRGFGFHPYITGLLFFALYSLAGLVLDLPFSLYRDFILEDHFGFNRKTATVFITDLLKNILITAILGAVIIFALLWLMQTTGALWWIYASLFICAFQFLMVWIAPTVIFPLFNRMTPLEGDRGDAVRELAAAADFPAKEVLTMDSSRRSGHADAFFTGFGRMKKIVFSDTLLEKTNTAQTLGVLAHEIGHYTLGHVRKRLLLMAGGVIVFFGFLALMKDYPLFYRSLGFQSESNYAALMIFSVIFHELVFPFQFLLTRLSRRHEYAADSFAVNLTRDPEALIEALEILHSVNLSAPVVHPAYSAYHYTHPDLPERIAAIRERAQDFTRDASPLQPASGRSG